MFVTITPMPAAPPAPAPIVVPPPALPSPLLYLDASSASTLTKTGTRVDAWSDLNGSGLGVATSVNGAGFNPTFTQSLFGGLGGVDFNGSKYLESADAFTGLNWATGFTILAAGQYVGNFFGISDSVAVVMGAGIGNRMGLGTAGLSSIGLPLVPCVFGVRWNGTTMRFILNGQTYPVYEGTPIPGSGAFGKLQIGMLAGSGGIKAKFAGIQFFNSALSYADIATLSAVMQTKYAIADLSAPTYNIVVDGNSLAAGYWTNDKTTMATGVLGVSGTTPMDMVNLATSAITTPALTARAAALVDPLLNTNVSANRCILIVWEITNDLSGTTQTDAAAYANIKAYCQARKAAGWKVIVCTCLPRTQAGINANFETYRLSVNASIVANATSEGWADYVADIASNATLGATGASNNTTYFNDKIHMKSAGHAIASTYVTAALMEMLA